MKLSIVIRAGNHFRDDMVKKYFRLRPASFDEYASAIKIPCQSQSRVRGQLFICWAERDSSGA
jgi:hypothetical protein